MSEPSPMMKRLRQFDGVKLERMTYRRSGDGSGWVIVVCVFGVALLAIAQLVLP